MPQVHELASSQLNWKGKRPFGINPTTFFLAEHRVVAKFHCRLWRSPYGFVMDSTILQCPWQSSFWSSQEALLSSSLGSRIIVPLDGGQGICSIANKLLSNPLYSSTNISCLHVQVNY